MTGERGASMRTACPWSGCPRSCPNGTKGRGAAADAARCWKHGHQQGRRGRRRTRRRRRCPRFAAAEALLAQAPLHLVHVLQIPAVDAYGGAYGGVLEDANGASRQRSGRARGLVDDRVPVRRNAVTTGSWSARLVEHADAGRMIVLQHRRLGRARRLVTGSTVNGVAARADVAVVSVPEGWTRARPATVVTVGVQDAQEAEQLLRTAFRRPTLGAPACRSTHAWWIHNGYDSMVADQSLPGAEGGRGGDRAPACPGRDQRGASRREGKPPGAARAIRRTPCWTPQDLRRPRAGPAPPPAAAGQPPRARPCAPSSTTVTARCCSSRSSGGRPGPGPPHRVMYLAIRCGHGRPRALAVRRGRAGHRSPGRCRA